LNVFQHNVAVNRLKQVHGNPYLHQPRTYIVTLTVKDVAGNSATHSITITVLSAQGVSIWVIGVTVLAIAIGIGVAATILWKRRR